MFDGKIQKKSKALDFIHLKIISASSKFNFLITCTTSRQSVFFVEEQHGALAVQHYKSWLLMPLAFVALPSYPLPSGMDSILREHHFCRHPQHLV